MTIIREGSKYVRVAHTGQSTGSLYLSDLDDESNKKQSRQMPVYVPEGEHVDLPMDDEVKHSYQKGTIAGFVDAGLATATVIEQEAGAAEVWVSPDGDDNNPGTRSAPFETPAYAVDYLQSNFDSGVVKRVRLLSHPDRYEGDPIVVNEPNVHLLGESQGNFGWEQNVDVALILTAMTRDAYEEYEDEGGLSFTEDGDIFTYDGPTLAGRGVVGSAEPLYQFNFKAKNIRFSTLDVTAVQAVMPIVDGDTGSALLNIAFEDCLIQKSGEGRPCLYLKNTFRASFRACHFDHNNELFFDNCGYTAFYAGTGSGLSDRIISRQDDTNETVEGKGNLASYPFSSLGAEGGMSTLLRTYGNVTGSLQRGSVLEDNLLPLRVVGEVTLKGATSLRTTRLTCGNFTKEHASAELLVGSIDCSGNVTISAGTSNAIKSGVIEGNLTISGGANIDLSGVIVKGNVDLTNAGTVVWKGGHFEGTLTDPDSKLGAATAGDYLYVT